MLTIRNLESGYGALRVLKGMSLHVSAGEIVTLIGANGAGKTTLLSTICGLLPARDGQILFDGRDVCGLRPEAIVRLGCALVPEGRQLFGPMTVHENLVLGACAQFRRGVSQKEIESDLSRVHTLFPKLKERSAQLAGTLSGGEQQMVAIGRALMSRPRLVMMDEPSTGLAPLVVKEILRAISLLRDSGTTVLLVEQNARAALGIADRGYVIETGQIVVEGTAADLLHNRDVQRAYLGREYRSIADER
ncbi:MAG TPA: ABC transporter ATP-binding protein [Planctomycetota bacterium]|jgi:branched-chain amino acid transport system ATP-binding protein